MAEFHPLINIDINKSYCIRKYSSRKTQSEQEKLLRELSEDKTNWSGKVLTKIHEIIQAHSYEVPYDILEVHFNYVKSVNHEFKDKVENMNVNQIISEMKKALDSSKEYNAVNEVFLQSNIKYKSFNDIQMAHIILLLSDLSKISEELWVSITLQLKELANVILYFLPEDGHIILSKRNRIPNDKQSIINQYIDSMNELIDGTREVPNIIR